MGGCVGQNRVSRWSCDRADVPLSNEGWCLASLYMWRHTILHLVRAEIVGSQEQDSDLVGLYSQPAEIKTRVDSVTRGIAY